MMRSHQPLWGMGNTPQVKRFFLFHFQYILALWIKLLLPKTLPNVTA